MTVWTMIAIMAGMLVLERLVVSLTTRNPRCQEVYRRHFLLHPNGISIMRLPMGIISICLAAMGYWVAGSLWFCFWMISDMSDGTIARNCNLETETGKWLDPLSDKMMYFPALIYLSAGNVFPWGLKILPVYLTVPFMVLDILGQFSRLFTKRKAANSFGKAKTALVTILLSLISLNIIDPLIIGGFEIMNSRFVFCLMTFCVALAFMSFYCKVIPGKWYANTLILMNFLCGVGAITFCTLAHQRDVQQYSAYAFGLVFLGQFFDLFDGRLAQIFGSTPNDTLYDEVADGTNFGFGIASIIFYNLAFQEKLIVPMLAFVIASAYMAASVINLVRARHMKMPIAPGTFCGLPVSAGAGLAGSAVLLGMEGESTRTSILAVCIVIASAVLMISRIPYQHFGQTLWPNLPRLIKMIFCVLLLVYICLTFSHGHRTAFLGMCFILSLAYALCGVDWKHLRRKKPGVSEG